MKKKFKIEVEIDTESYANGPYFGTCAAGSRLNGHEYKVLVYKDACELVSGLTPENVTLTAVLHELGHVIGEELEMPGQLSDPRPGLHLTSGTPCLNTINTEVGLSALRNAELEAWDIAQKGFDAIRKQTGKNYEIQIEWRRCWWLPVETGK